MLQFIRTLMERLLDAERRDTATAKGEAKTGFENESTEDITAACEAHWEDTDEALLENRRELARRNHVSFQAIAELATRGTDVVPWVLKHCHHVAPEARMQMAYLLGQLGSKGHLGEQTEAAIKELSLLAASQVSDEPDDLAVNQAAITALANIGTDIAIPAIGIVLLGKEWDGHPLQLDAANALGSVVGETFYEADDCIATAQQWLIDHRPSAPA